MGSVRLEVLWSPVHPDKFIAWGTDIFLYEIGEIQKEKRPSVIQTSETSEAVLLATNSAHRYVKCIDICPLPEDILLAVGQANGKVVLTSFGAAKSEVVGREFAPLQARQCNSVLWNRVETNIIAVALEKCRTEPAVLLWDAHRPPYYFANGEYVKPLSEFGVSETANSLAWINSHLLVVGLNNKNLRIVDRRDVTKTVHTTQTKAVLGVTVDPNNEMILASYFENQICVWDVRNFDKPISTMSRMKTVSKISWCPSRQNLLASLQRDSNVIMLHDLQLTSSGTEEVEPGVLERSVQPSPSHNIASFSWHPSVESRLLAISLSGHITDYRVIERITLNWLPCSHLVWTHGRRTLKVVSDRDPIYASFEDISVKIKRRAVQEYGLKPELWQNGELAEDDALKKLWYWLDASRALVEDGAIRSGNYHPGIIPTLCMESVKNRSELASVQWTDLTSIARVYRSEERSAALQLCGWNFEKDPQALTSFLQGLQVEGAHSRAAAISVFNLRLRLAIQILNHGAADLQRGSPSLGIVAMALSGFSDERSSMWREHCIKSRDSLSDPYLRAAFAFLTAENDNYESVLGEQGLAVEDRVAFAVTFLSDSRLAEYLLRLSERLTEEGNLSGMLLTGASPEGAKLLQRYLDKTGDVQSVSLIAVRALPFEMQRDQNVQIWIDSYQQLLDSKRLWNQRAHFDIALNMANQCERLPQQVFVSCNFCGKSISAYMQAITRARGQCTRVGPTNKLKISSCPNCRKPLPRCAICLAHMGTPSRLSPEGDRPPAFKMAELSSWFTWCQSCRHGGHAGHMSHWFKSHPECPVTGCVCKCLSLDPSGTHYS